MTVAQAHALPSYGRHCRGGVVVDHAKAQAIGDKQDNIVRPRRLHLCHGRRAEQGLPEDDLQKRGTEEKRPAHDELRAKTGEYPFWRSRMTLV